MIPKRKKGPRKGTLRHTVDRFASYALLAWSAWSAAHSNMPLATYLLFFAGALELDNRS